ncbi:retinal-binding protein [Caerostris extrusa]|uniref:Retinal-binding protein n=1 Tax=Caerostris extrusa TaxID=172846 RepID=A0AAV4TN27_CAEEX|nr:retinal-binding protein [Caerostris extrusa]
MYIHNYEKITLGLATNKAALELFLIAVKMYQDNYPERIKSIHIINASIYFSMIFTFVKSFVAPAVLAKLHIFWPSRHRAITATSKINSKDRHHLNLLNWNPVILFSECPSSKSEVFSIVTISSLILKLRKRFEHSNKTIVAIKQLALLLSSLNVLSQIRLLLLLAGHFLGLLFLDKWRDAFLQLIDANDLPAFLGGNRTDPDGNPLCLSFVIHPKIIPESYYLQKSEKKLSLCPGVKKVIVTRHSKEIISFDVQKENSLLEWEFETKNRDIAFGVYFKEDLHENSKPIEVIPKQRLDSYYDTETGTYKCEKTGTYFAMFDNSYSWFFPKEIYYRMRVVSPHDTASTD